MAKSDSPQSRGGRARAEKLSDSQRSEVARVAAEARWATSRDLPKATHGSAEHPLKIGEIEIPCYVLEDGTRVLSQRGLQTGIGMSIGGSSRAGEQRMAVFVDGLARKGVNTKDLAARIREPIRFISPAGGAATFGYEATILADLCDVVLDAREQGALHPQQAHIAVQCEILIRAFAKIGIVALVDEATGFQKHRERDELHKLLSIYLAEERLAWAKRFPDEFYRQIYRLRGWKWPVGKAKTPLLGHITNDVVYERLPPGVIDQLRVINPTDEETKRRKFKHHQFLSAEVGQPDLRDHILQVIPLMKISKDWKSFKKNLDVAFPKLGTQLEMDVEDLEEGI